MRKVVSNTTPLIALSDIGQLELLKSLYGKIIIPEAVLEEIESEPFIDMLVDDGLYVDQKTRNMALKMAGEM